jgi:predicted lipid-binding transport protein (Tim44 family)
MKWSVVVLALTLLLSGVEADAAKRLGGGKSLGRQSSNVSQREAAPVAPGVVPTQNATSPAYAGPPVAPTRRPWGGMLGGLAAGLGLAWLVNSMGLGEAFGQLVLWVLIAVGVMLLIGALKRSRRAAALPRAGAHFAFEGAGNVQLGTAPAYRPENVGNDASARPFERTNLQALEDSGAGAAGAAWSVPAGFDTAGFLQAAKANFINLQAAWDRSDIGALRAMMTDSMLSEIRTQLAEREAHAGSEPNTTEVVMIEARLLGIEELADEYLSSVEFSGMIREEPSAGPSPFREVWNMSKTKIGGSGWLVAGVQALQ